MFTMCVYAKTVLNVWKETMRQDAPPLPTVGTQPFAGFRTSVADGNGVRDANALEEGGQQGAAWSREGGGLGQAQLDSGTQIFAIWERWRASERRWDRSPAPPPAMTPHINIQ